MDIRDRFADYRDGNDRRELRGEEPLPEEEIARRVFCEALEEEGYTPREAEVVLEHVENKYGAIGDEFGVKEHLTDAREFLESASKLGTSRQSPKVTREIVPPPRPPAWFRWFSAEELCRYRSLQYELLHEVGRISAEKARAGKRITRREMEKRRGYRHQSPEDLSMPIKQEPVCTPEEGIQPGDFVPLEELDALMENLSPEQREKLETWTEAFAQQFGWERYEALAWLLCGESVPLPYMNSTLVAGGNVLPTGYVNLRVHPSVSPNRVRDWYIHARKKLKDELIPQAFGPETYRPHLNPEKFLLDGLRIEDQTFELLVFASRCKKEGYSWEEIYREWDAEHPGTYTLRSMQQAFYSHQELTKTIATVEEETNGGVVPMYPRRVEKGEDHG